MRDAKGGSEVTGAFLPRRWGQEWPRYRSAWVARIPSARTTRGEWKMRRV